MWRKIPKYKLYDGLKLYCRLGQKLIILKKARGSKDTYVCLYGDKQYFLSESYIKSVYAPEIHKVLFDD